MFDTGFGAITPFDQQMQQPVNLIIGEPQLVFIGLTLPQVSRGRLVDHRIRYTQMPSQLAHLGFIQVAQRLQGHG